MTEAKAKHGVVHHHEALLGLVLQILLCPSGTHTYERGEGKQLFSFLIFHSSNMTSSVLQHIYLTDLSGGEVPNLNEPVHGARDQELAIGGEACAFHVRPSSKLRVRTLTLSKHSLLLLVTKKNVLILLPMPPVKQVYWEIKHKMMSGSPGEALGFPPRCILKLCGLISFTLGPEKREQATQAAPSGRRWWKRSQRPKTRALRGAKQLGVKIRVHVLCVRVCVCMCPCAPVANIFFYKHIHVLNLLTVHHHPNIEVLQISK